jgi:hypothetical protein
MFRRTYRHHLQGSLGCRIPQLCYRESLLISLSIDGHYYCNMFKALLWKIKIRFWRHIQLSDLVCSFILSDNRKVLSPKLYTCRAPRLRRVLLEKWALMPRVHQGKWQRQSNLNFRELLSERVLHEELNRTELNWTELNWTELSITKQGTATRLQRNAWQQPLRDWVTQSFQLRCSAVSSFSCCDVLICHSCASLDGTKCWWSC